MENDSFWLNTPPSPPVTAPALDDLQPAPGSEEIASPPVRDRGKLLRSAGIVATAVVVGAIGVTTLTGSSSASTTASNGPGGFGGPGGQAPPGSSSQQGTTGRDVGGRAGVVGTVSKVSASSITVAEADGTSTTVKVTSATLVMKDGATSSVSALAQGDTVFVHTEGTGSSAYAERIMVGGFPARGQGFGGPPGAGSGTAPDPGTQQGTQPGTSTTGATSST
jgi:hypothetical protein